MSAQSDDVDPLDEVLEGELTSEQKEIVARMIALLELHYDADRTRVKTLLMSGNSLDWALKYEKVELAKGLAECGFDIHDPSALYQCVSEHFEREALRKRYEKMKVDYPDSWRDFVQDVPGYPLAEMEQALLSSGASWQEVFDDEKLLHPRSAKSEEVHAAIVKYVFARHADAVAAERCQALAAKHEQQLQQQQQQHAQQLQQLQQQHAQTLQQRQTEHNTALNAVQGQLIASVADVWALQQRVGQRDVTVNTQQQQLADRQTTIDNQQQQLEARHGQLQRSAADVRARDDTIRAQRQQLADKQTTIDNQQQRLLDKETLLRQKQAAINSWREDVAERDALLAQKQAAFDQQQQQLTTRNSQLQQSAADVSARDETIRAQRQELADKQATIDTQQQRLVEKQTQLGNKQAVINHQQQQISDMKALLAQRQTTIDLKQQQLTQKQAQLVQKDVTIAEQTAAAATAVGEKQQAEHALAARRVAHESLLKSNAVASNVTAVVVLIMTIASLAELTGHPIVPRQFNN
jgi:hypothetical protein